MTFKVLPNQMLECRGMYYIGDPKFVIPEGTEWNDFIRALKEVDGNQRAGTVTYTHGENEFKFVYSYTANGVGKFPVTMSESEKEIEVVSGLLVVFPGILARHFDKLVEGERYGAVASIDNEKVMAIGDGTISGQRFDVDSRPIVESTPKSNMDYEEARRAMKDPIDVSEDSHDFYGEVYGK